MASTLVGRPWLPSCTSRSRSAGHFGGTATHQSLKVGAQVDGEFVDILVRHVPAVRAHAAVSVCAAGSGIAAGAVSSAAKAVPCAAIRPNRKTGRSVGMRMFISVQLLPRSQWV